MSRRTERRAVDSSALLSHTVKRTLPFHLPMSPSIQKLIPGKLPNVQPRRAAQRHQQCPSPLPPSPFFHGQVLAHPADWTPLTWVHSTCEKSVNFMNWTKSEQKKPNPGFVGLSLGEQQSFSSKRWISFINCKKFGVGDGSAEIPQALKSFEPKGETLI